MSLKPEDLVEAEDSKEFWNVYKFSDGTTVKLVLRGVKRLKNGVQTAHQCI